MYNERVKSNTPKLFVHASGGVGSKTEELGYKCPFHYHDELEFIIIYDGEFVIECEGDEYVAKSGDIVFINSGVPHRTRADMPSITGLVQFRENDYINGELTKVIRYSRRFSGAGNPPIAILHSPELIETLSELIDEAKGAKQACDLFVKSAIYKILGTLYRMNVLADADEMLAEKDIQKILPVLSHLNTHYFEDIRLKDVSDMLNFDESYFCRIFKNAIGATFTEYLNFVRVCKSEKLLKKTQKSILEISETVGFSSVSYFNRMFKKYRHISPRAYRGMLYKTI